MDKRQAIRREVRQRRRALSPIQQQQASRAMFRLMMRQPLFVRSRNIAFYLANDGEISPHFLLQQAQRMGKRCYLPVLKPGVENRLWFARYYRDTSLYMNHFGIYEPMPEASSLIRARQLDLVLLPLVAFDRQGGRLGMGGGFYDRSFSFKNASSVSAHKPYLMGLAHRCQEVESLELAHWDIPLHAVATDAGLIISNSAAKKRDFNPGDL